MSSGSIRDHRRARRPVAVAGRGTPRRRWWPGLIVVALGLAAICVGIGAGSDVVQALAPASPFDGPLADCRIDDRLTPHRRSDDWARTLLDQEYALAADDVPADLVLLADHGIEGSGSLRAFVIDHLATMADAARAANVPFRVSSAYRSYQQQVKTFASLETATGHDEALRSAARPGHSEHQLGTTVDIDTDGAGEAWLATNGWRYGFVVSYPPEYSPESTCYKPEPWHVRYLGPESALAVEQSGLSLRAWLWQRQTGD